ncbi:MAG: putative integral rane protein [Myxococcales bacterium]|nr:putative integral rane protein [Myxococcales bacterium]
MINHTHPLSSPALTSGPTTGRALRASLWVTQAILALAFGFSGAAKAFLPLDRVAGMIPWSPDVAPALLRFIGVTELLAAVGLVLPSLLRVRPRLTPLAALGLVVVMTLASGFHALRHEPAGIVATVVLGGLAAFVAWGRFRAAPIGGRS